jgi:hypothetical protein
MRTTVAIDDDVFAVARSHAQREHITLGQALSRLAREGIRARSLPVATHGSPACRFSLLPARDEIITSEHVRDLMDQEGI